MVPGVERAALGNGIVQYRIDDPKYLFDVP